MNIKELTKEQITELERLSNEVKKGNSVDFVEALAVIEYQTGKKYSSRFIHWISSLFR